MAGTGECTGLVKVLIGTRFPSGVEASRTLFELSVSYEEA
jgi:hypothetical protein